jgi:hypothetical protein
MLPKLQAVSQNNLELVILPLTRVTGIPCQGSSWQCEHYLLRDQLTTGLATMTQLTTGLATMTLLTTGLATMTQLQPSPV